MRVSGLWARLFFLGLVVALVGLLGVAPVGAQDESGSAEDAADEAAGDDGGSGDELLAKALELARSIEAGDAAQPPVRVESRQHSFIEQEGEAIAGLPATPLDLRYVSLVDSRGNSQAIYVDPQYLGDDLLKLPEAFRQYLSVRSQKPLTIVDGIAYTPNNAATFVNDPDIVTKLDPDKPWLSRVVDDVVDKESDTDTKILNTFFGGADTLTIFTGAIGEGQYLANLLSHADSASSVGQSTIRGHETTELRVNIPGIELIYTTFGTLLDALQSSLLLDIPLPMPSNAFLSEVLGPDNVMEFNIWIDEAGRVHRLAIDYSEEFLTYVESAFSGIVDIAPGDLTHTLNSEFIYLEEDPVIQAPAADEVLAIESYGTYLEGLRAAPESAGDELADTGSNTLLWAIAGISVVLAGAMVLALSRRLRAQQIR